MKSYDPRYAGPNPPCTSTISDKSFLIEILPYLDQAALYNSINQSLTILGAENSTSHAVAVGAYACPDDPQAGIVRTLNPGALSDYGTADPALMVFTSYAGCAGSILAPALPWPSNQCTPPAQGVEQNNGCFNDVSPIRFASVTDGLSNTIFVLEKSVSSLRFLDALRKGDSNKHGWYVNGNWGDTVATTFYPPNAIDRVALAAAAAIENSASSEHPAGLNVLMGDGSVRFIKNSIATWRFNALTGRPTGATSTGEGWWQGLPSPGVWQALSTRDGGETIPSDRY